MNTSWAQSTRAPDIDAVFDSCTILQRKGDVLDSRKEVVFQSLSRSLSELQPVRMLQTTDPGPTNEKFCFLKKEIPQGVQMTSSWKKLITELLFKHSETTTKNPLGKLKHFCVRSTCTPPYYRVVLT